MDGESCDDGTKNNEGCNESCTGPIDGWNCVGNNVTTCTEICGDGIVVGRENCDDKLDDDIGCKLGC